jgi:hypothetical protein
VVERQWKDHAALLRVPESCMPTPEFCLRYIKRKHEAGHLPYFTLHLKHALVLSFPIAFSARATLSSTRRLQSLVVSLEAK